jgi:hypothetical protein
LITTPWIGIKSFFSGVGDAVVYSEEEAKSLLMLGNTWVDMGGVGQPTSTVVRNEPEEPFTSFQFRLILAGARIVLPARTDAESSHETEGVTLRLDLDYLHESLEGGGSNMHCFVHNLELFTGVAKNPRRYSSDSSLLHPLSFVVGRSKESGEGGAQELRVVSGVVTTRCNYSDMSLAIDVGVQLMNDVKKNKRAAPPSPSPSPSPPPAPRRQQVKVQCAGLSLLIIDDSNRHFAAAQPLVQFSMQNLSFQQTVTDSEKTSEKALEKELSLILNKLVVTDFLQPEQSEFRLAAYVLPPQPVSYQPVRASSGGRVRHMKRALGGAPHEASSGGRVRHMKRALGAACEGFLRAGGLPPTTP